MELLIILLLFGSIATAVFFMVGAEKQPQTGLLYKMQRPYAPIGFLAKKQWEVRKAISKALGPLGKFLNDKMGIGERVQRNIISAGSKISPGEFLAFKLLLAMALALMVSFFPEVRENFVFIFLAAVIGWFLPDMSLRKKIQKRHRAIMRDLPMIIDLLILCIDAGLDFMLAVERTIREYKRESVLIEELKGLSREIKMGFTRAQALRNLSVRVNMTEMSSFSRTLIQADKLGSPIGDALRIQAEEMRTRRFQRGEEMALKAPIKLLVPLLFCILPVVLIIVGGPILIRFMKGGFGIGGM